MMGSNPTAAGKRASFEREALVHDAAVYRFARQLTRSEERAQTLVRDTFVRAYAHWHRHMPGTKCKGWLFAILWERALEDGGRSGAEGDGFPGSGDANDPLAGPPCDAVTESDPEGRFFALIAGASIAEAIDALPHEKRLVLFLVDGEGLSYAESARVVGTDVDTLKCRLFKARRRLQRALFALGVRTGQLPQRWNDVD